MTPRHLRPLSCQVHKSSPRLRSVLSLSDFTAFPSFGFSKVFATFPLKVRTDPAHPYSRRLQADQISSFGISTAAVGNQYYFSYHRNTIIAVLESNLAHSLLSLL
jgi:hypothetical protein